MNISDSGLGLEDNSESVRQNFTTEVEEALNQQISFELSVSYQYLALANFFARPTVSFPGSAKFFYKQSIEERNHALKLIEYLNLRGGTVLLTSIQSPDNQRWYNLQDAFINALELEKKNNEFLLGLHEIASEKNDPDLSNFLEEFFLKVQVNEIEKLGNYVNQLKRVGLGLGEHLWDHQLYLEQKE